MSLFYALALAALLASSQPDLEAIVRERAAAHAVSGDYLASIAACESRWDTFAVGLLGEEGLFQIAPWGERREFRARGYTDAFDPWQAADFAAMRFSEGAARSWSCAR